MFIRLLPTVVVHSGKEGVLSSYLSWNPLKQVVIQRVHVAGEPGVFLCAEVRYCSSGPGARTDAISCVLLVTLQRTIPHPRKTTPKKMTTIRTNQSCTG